MRLDNYLNESKVKKATMKADMKLKSGDVIAKGTKVSYEFIEGKDAYYRLTNIETGKTIMGSLQTAYKYLPGFNKVPGDKALERMISTGIAKTVTGKKTEPDGYGPDDSPSWLLALEMI